MTVPVIVVAGSDLDMLLVGPDTSTVAAALTPAVD